MNDSDPAHLEALGHLIKEVDRVGHAADAVREQIDADLVAARLRDQPQTPGLRRRLPRLREATKR